MCVTSITGTGIQGAGGAFPALPATAGKAAHPTVMQLSDLQGALAPGASLIIPSKPFDLKIGEQTYRIAKLPVSVRRTPVFMVDKATLDGPTAPHRLVSGGFLFMHAAGAEIRFHGNGFPTAARLAEDALFSSTSGALSFAMPMGALATNLDTVGNIQAGVIRDFNLRMDKPQVTTPSSAVKVASAEVRAVQAYTLTAFSRFRDLRDAVLELVLADGTRIVLKVLNDRVPDPLPTATEKAATLFSSAVPINEKLSAPLVFMARMPSNAFGFKTGDVVNVSLDNASRQITLEKQ